MESRLKGLNREEIESVVFSLLYKNPRKVLNEIERVEKKENQVFVNNVNRPGLMDEKIKVKL